MITKIELPNLEKLKEIEQEYNKLRLKVREIICFYYTGECISIDCDQITNIHILDSYGIVTTDYFYYDEQNCIHWVSKTFPYYWLGLPSKDLLILVRAYKEEEVITNVEKSNSDKIDETIPF